MLDCSPQTAIPSADDLTEVYSLDSIEESICRGLFRIIHNNTIVIILFYKMFILITSRKKTIISIIEL